MLDWMLTWHQVGKIAGELLGRCPHCLWKNLHFNQEEKEIYCTNINKGLKHIFRLLNDSNTCILKLTMHWEQHLHCKWIDKCSNFHFSFGKAANLPLHWSIVSCSQSNFNHFRTYWWNSCMTTYLASRTVVCSTSVQRYVWAQQHAVR